MKYSLSLVFIMIFSFIHGQKTESFYKHMEGQINDNIFLVADLILTGEEIKGTYYYFYDVEEAGENAVHYGKTIPLTGTMDRDNFITFTEFELEGSSAAYRGVLIDGSRIEGTWKNDASKKELPFILTETYPDGSVPFRVYHHIASQPLVENETTPVAMLEQTLLLPAYHQHPDVNDSIAKVIRKCFFGKYVTEADPENMMMQEEEMYFKNYKNTNAGIAEGNSTFAWEKEKIINVHFNQDHFLTLECYNYGYTGGAHGLPMSKFIVLDLTDGHRLTLDEVFRAEYKNDLQYLINSELRKIHHLKPNTPLKDAGFYVQELEPTGNFYLNKDGIGFYYNRYEVAPYAMGHTDVFIPLDKLKRYLAPGSPLLRLSGGQ